jgi:hypothetical protein
MHDRGAPATATQEKNANCTLLVAAHENQHDDDGIAPTRPLPRDHSVVGGRNGRHTSPIIQRIVKGIKMVSRIFKGIKITRNIK